MRQKSYVLKKVWEKKRKSCESNLSFVGEILLTYGSIFFQQENVSLMGEGAQQNYIHFVGAEITGPVSLQSDR